MSANFQTDSVHNYITVDKSCKVAITCFPKMLCDEIVQNFTSQVARDSSVSYFVEKLFKNWMIPAQNIDPKSLYKQKGWIQ